MTKLVLIVDDQNDIRKIMKDKLTNAGYEVIEAASGEAGISLAERDNPGLILMDMQLPGVDGYEATRRIKSNPELGHIPIIAITSYALLGDKAKAMNSGCNDYMTKPFSPRELLVRVSKYLPLIDPVIRP